MDKSIVPIFSKLSLVIFIFLLIYYFFAGISSFPWEGDSLAYHIPIAKLILSGHIVNPALETYSLPTDFYRLYQPGAIESILSLLILTKIPLNIFDLFGIVFLFFSIYKLAKSFKLDNNLSLLFATSFSILHTVMRWVLSQTIDVWLVAFFAVSLALMQSPKKSWQYFLSLGFTLGMVMGGKYTGPAFVLFLLIIYGKNLISKLSLKNFLIFCFPFLVFGMSWYIRNLILTGDPYFPQSIPFFKGIPYGVLDYPAGKMLVKFPKVWFDAFFSEYTVWGLSLFITPFFAIKYKVESLIKLSVLGILCFIIYFFLPSGLNADLITSGFRYTYPAFIPLILGVFLLAKKFNKEVELSIIALTNMLILPELSYHPKILIILIPIALIILKGDKFLDRLKV